MEINYTLNLGQLLKMAHELKINLWQKMKLDKKYNVTKVVMEKNTICNTTNNNNNYSY